MLKRISAEVDNIDFELQNNNDIWSNSLKAPKEAKEYKVKITAEDMAGNITINENKKLVVTAKERLILYLPEYWHTVKEMYSLCKSEDIEIDFLHWNIKSVHGEQFIITASEKRINQWEKFLRISPKGTLDDRKEYILSVFQSSLKLNEKNIRAIIKRLNGKGAVVKLENSNLIIEAFSDINKDFLSTIENIINPRLPTHLGLNLKKYWSMWNDLKSDYKERSWEQEMTDFKDWNAIINYIPPRLL